MSNNKVEVKSFSSEIGLADYLNKNYLNQIKNFFSDEKKALKFLSSVRADVQRNPKLLECTAESIVNSYLVMAQMGFMPSTISGEGYVLPYNNSKKVGNEWKSVMEAQFQIGYQGFVTLFYLAGVQKIFSDIVRKNDKFTYINGEMKHEIDLTLSNKERGEAIGTYVTVVFRGESITRYMNMKDILDHAKRFSKSYDPKGKYSPWNPDNDPELNMPRKTVLKQMAKYLPKNEIINKAIAVDNKDSVLGDRLEEAQRETEQLKMGNLLKAPNEEKQPEKEPDPEADYSQESPTYEESQDQNDSSESVSDASPFPNKRKK